MVLGNQAAPDLFLIAVRLVAHRRNELPRPYILFRMPVTVQAPLHAQRGCLPRQRHLVYAAVAGFATHPFGDMNTMVEIDKIREIVNSRPIQRFTRPEARPHWLEHRTRSPDLRMAIHARSGGGNICETRGFYRRVAIAA